MLSNMNFFSILFLALFANGAFAKVIPHLTNALKSSVSSGLQTSSTTKPETTTISAEEKPVPSEYFPHTVQLDADGAYWLFWKANETHITFETHVKTRGYIGFGLSGNGQMFPGDVVIGWVENGVTHLKDCHTTGHVMPVEDESQDWISLFGEENDFGTTLKFIRKLETCDDNDFKITDETVRVIFSYHPNDPVAMKSLPWHGTSRRGTKSLLLLSATNQPHGIPDNAKTFELLKDHYHVPAVGTTYHCSTYRLPHIPEKNHIIKYTPVIQPENELHVHHFVIYTVPTDVDSRYDNINYDCTLDKDTPEALKERTVFIVWAVGGGTYYFPENVGMPIGTKGDPTFFILETHYDNPTLKSDIVDSSGMRFTYTPTLRQHDAGIIYTGMAVSPVHMIPPFEKEFITRGYCGKECSEQEVPDDGVNVFAVFQHAHLLATGITTKHFRNGTELKPFAHDGHYDFNFQDVRSLRHERKFLKGDSISVECHYNTERNTKLAFGGISTEEEMCVSTLLYYPRMKLDGCQSFPMYEAVNETDVRAAMETIKTWDWTDPSVRNNFKSLVRESDHTFTCSGANMTPRYTYVRRKINEPTQRYVPPADHCPKY